MSFFDTLNVSASGLTAQRLRMDVLSQNIAHVDTTKTADGTPYKRRVVLFEERTQQPFSTYFQTALKSRTANQNPKGVMVAKITEDNTQGARIYQPEHPDADAAGYVTMPNVNVVTEMVNMISASRSYEANISAMNITKGMIAKTLEIGSR